MSPSASTPGRRFALWIGVVAVIIVGWAILSHRDVLLERYDLWRLETGELAAREAAARRLAAHGSEKAVPILGQFIKKEDDFALVAIECLVRIGPPGTFELEQRFPEQSDPFRERAIDVIARQDPPDEAFLPFLTHVVLRDPYERVRGIAAHKGLTRFGEKAVPGLVAGLSDEECQQNALIFLGVLREDAAAAVPSIVRVVRGGGRYATEAGSTLAYVGKPALPALVELLRDPDGSARWESVRSLGRMKSAAAPAVPALVDTLHDPTYRVRERVVWTLAAVGPPAAEAIPALLGALQDETFGKRDRNVWIGRGDPRWNARAQIPQALIAVGGGGEATRETVIDVLLASLDDRNPCVAAGAVRALGDLGPAAVRAAPRLRELSSRPVREKSDPPGYHLLRCDDQIPVFAMDALERIAGGPSDSGIDGSGD